MNPSKDPADRSRVLGINRRNLDFVFKDHFPGRFRELDDKLATKRRLEAAGIPCPRTLAVIRDRADLSRLKTVLEDLDQLVVKPACGSGGNGILVLERHGDTWRRLSGETLSLDGIRSHVEQILAGAFSMDESQDTAILEERINAHPFFLSLFREGLADIRIVLHRGKPIQAMCRLPSSASEGKANLHSGGVGLGIDVESGGTLGGVCEGLTVDAHPDSGIPLAGLVIPEWEACLETAIAASGVVDVEYLGVDIVLDRDQGPMVLELNARPGLDIQIANREGQPVDPPGPSSGAERFTWFVAWTLLAALAASPLFYSRWRSVKGQETPISVASIPDAMAAQDPGPVTAYRGIDWEDEEVPLSSLHERFREARTLAAAGDTAAAISAYRASMADSSVAPFALNNIALIHRRRGQLETAEATLREAIARFPDYVRGHYNLGLVLLDEEDMAGALAEFQSALEVDGSHSKSWAKTAEIQLETGRAEEAAASYEQAVRFAPTARTYRFGLGQAYRKTRRYDAAAQCFEQVLALDPDSEEAAYWHVRSRIDAAYETGAVLSKADLKSLAREIQPCAGEKNGPDDCRVLMAELDWERGRFSEALELHESMVAANVNPSFHRRAGAVAALEIGLWDRAQTLLDGLPPGQEPEASWIETCRIGRFLDVEGLGSGRPGIEMEPSGEVLREAVRLRLAAEGERTRRARETFVEENQDPLASLLLFPDSIDGPAGDGDMKTRLREHLPPRDRFRERLRSRSLPGSLVLWTLFQSAETGGRDSLAAATLSVLRERDPEFRPMLFHEFQEALADGREKSARLLGEKLLDLTPEDPDLLVGLANLHVNSGSEKKAREYLDRLTPADRRQIPARVVEARILLIEGRRGDAVRLLRELTHGSPSDIDARLALADAYLVTGQRKRGIQALRLALAGTPGRKDIRRRLARELMNVRRYEEASVEWGRLIKLDPENLSNRFNLALCLQRDGKLEDAVAEYDKVLSKNPANTKAWFNRSLAMEDLGRPAEAQMGYRRVLKLDPDHTKSREKLTALQGVQ